MRPTRVVYFHGAPGGPGEIGLFAPAACAAGVRVTPLDRAAVAPHLAGDDYFRALAARVEAETGGEAFHLMGFSLGAFVALRTSAFLARPPASIQLVSAAAPLESGDFLKAMAGQAVFAAARRGEAGFARLTAMQGWLAARAPRLLYALLFANVRGGDKALSATADFRSLLGGTLNTALNADRAGYERDVLAYVRPWAGDLREVRAPVWLWHGAEDNWAPPGMAACLAAAVPAAAEPRVLPGASHYSALIAAAPMIFAALTESRRAA